MITRNLLTLIAFGGTVALVACSSVEDPVPFASSESFCTSKAETECKNLAISCGASVDACKQKRASVCNGAASTAAGQGRSYRANAAQACIDKAEAVFKEKVISPEGDLEVVKICERVYGGTRKERERCENTFECEGALICSSGVCATEETVSGTGACGNPGQVCAKGSYCQQQGGNKFCVAKNKLDEACGAENPCLETLRCVVRCKAKVAISGDCEVDSDCADEAPYCDVAAGKKCGPKYQAATAACKEFRGP